MSKRTKPSNVAIAYLRVSTDEQALGPDAQRAAIERWATANGVNVVAWHADLGVSGGTDAAERPGLVEALADVRRLRAPMLIVAKRDRLARDVVIAGLIERELARGHARLVSADGVGAGDAPTDRLMATVVDAFGEFERGMIRTRTKSALAVKRARNERVGTVPFGSRLDDDGVHLVADQGEQAIIARVRTLRAQGSTIRAIVGTLAGEGVIGRKGKALGVDAVHRIASAA